MSKLCWKIENNSNVSVSDEANRLALHETTAEVKEEIRTTSPNNEYDQGDFDDMPDDQFYDENYVEDDLLFEGRLRFL